MPQKTFYAHKTKNKPCFCHCPPEHVGRTLRADTKNRVCFWLYAYKKFLVALFMIRKMEEENLPVSIANIRFDMGICIRYNRIQAEANFPGKKSNGKEQLLHSKYKK